MTTKEKIIRQSIAENEKELAEIVALLDATPASDIIAGRKKAQELLAKYDVSDPLLAQKIGVLAEAEKRLFAIAEKQRDSTALINRRVKLDIELQDLKNELYWIERKDS